MDPITEFAFNINNELLAQASLLLNNNLVFTVLVIAIVLFAERRDSKRIKIFSALLIAFVFSIVLKSAFAVERPCAQLGLDYCPGDYSFPSMHATIAFTLMVAFLNKRSFWVFMLFALFVSFSRLVIAAHSFADIAAALPVALVSYYMIDVLWRRYFNEKGN